MIYLKGNNDLEGIYPGDTSKFIGQCLCKHIYIWHIREEKNQFLPAWDDLDKVLLYIDGQSILAPKADIVKYSYEEAKPYMHYFEFVFAIDWMVSPDFHVPILIIPKAKKEEIENLIDKYKLTKYKDLIWHLLFRLQHFYAERIFANTVDNKEYTNLIYELKQSNKTLVKLIDQYLINDGKEINALSLSYIYGSEVCSIKDRFLIEMLIESYLNIHCLDRLTGKLYSDWRERILNADHSKIMKDDYKYLHLKFTQAAIKFLRSEKIVSNKSDVAADFLNPIVEILNLSEYPFLDYVTIKNLQSLLTTERKSRK